MILNRIIKKQYLVTGNWSQSRVTNPLVYLYHFIPYREQHVFSSVIQILQELVRRRVCVERSGFKLLRNNCIFRERQLFENWFKFAQRR